MNLFPRHVTNGMAWKKTVLHLSNSQRILLKSEVLNEEVEAIEYELCGLRGMAESTEQGRKYSVQLFQIFLDTKLMGKFNDLSKDDLTNDKEIFQEYGGFLIDRRINYTKFVALNRN